jgi:hypothetical protein
MMNLKSKWRNFKEKIWNSLERAWNKFQELIEPHREYVGEEVYRTKIFWSNMFHSLLAAYIFSITDSFVYVAAMVIIMHLIDFGFWYIQENHFNFNPMEGLVGRRS